MQLPAQTAFTHTFFKKCKNELVKPLRFLWSKSLETGTLLEVLRTRNIASTHKGGIRGLVSQAFDRIDHGILLLKLQNLGITGLLGRWLHSFLLGRTQRISVHGELLLVELSQVRSGVPHGSVFRAVAFHR